MEQDGRAVRFINVALWHRRVKHSSVNHCWPVDHSHRFIDIRTENKEGEREEVNSPENKSARLLFELIQNLGLKNERLRNIFARIFSYGADWVSAMLAWKQHWNYRFAAPLTSFCSNIMWLYNLWNCSKSRRSFFAPTSCWSGKTKALTYHFERVGLKNLRLNKQMVNFDNEQSRVRRLNLSSRLMMSCWENYDTLKGNEEEYQELLFENAGTRRLVVDQRQQRLQLLHGDAV